jgi:hypothetical protein
VECAPIHGSDQAGIPLLDGVEHDDLMHRVRHPALCTSN